MSVDIEKFESFPPYVRRRAVPHTQPCMSDEWYSNDPPHCEHEKPQKLKQ